jgi:hypothetical protein
MILIHLKQSHNPATQRQCPQLVFDKVVESQRLISDFLLYPANKNVPVVTEGLWTTLQNEDRKDLSLTKMMKEINDAFPSRNIPKKLNRSQSEVLFKHSGVIVSWCLQHIDLVFSDGSYEGDNPNSRDAGAMQAVRDLFARGCGRVIIVYGARHDFSSHAAAYHWTLHEEWTVAKSFVERIYRRIGVKGIESDAKRQLLNRMKNDVDRVIIPNHITKALTHPEQAKEEKEVDMEAMIKKLSWIDKVTVTGKMSTDDSPRSYWIWTWYDSQHRYHITNPEEGFRMQRTWFRYDETQQIFIENNNKRTFKVSVWVSK